MSTDSRFYLDNADESLNISEYISLFKRRRYQFIFPLVVIFLLSLLLALGLPKSYRATATILIEEQEIPRELVQSTITSYAAQQIHVITRRVLTQENIQGLVNKYQLYNQDKKQYKMPISDLIESFNDDFTLELVSADVLDPRSGKATEATIAFSLSFDSSDAGVSQKVTSDLVNLYLEENLRTRSIKVAGASDFLHSEVDAINVELVEWEEKISQFKQEKKGALPELYQFNVTVLERAEQDLADVTLRLQQLVKREVEIASELAQTDPSASILLAGRGGLLNEAGRLKALQSEYRTKVALYHGNHPDVQRLRREIDILKKASPEYDRPENIAAELSFRRETLNELLGRYTSDHPKVLTAQRVVADLEDKLEYVINPVVEANNTLPDNPVYVLLATQLKSTQLEIKQLQVQQAQIQNKIAEYEELIRRGPGVEKDYQLLLRGYEAAQSRFQEVKAKQREADAARNLEQGRKGERFTLIAPPLVPLDPNSPNNLTIIFLGGFLGLCVGSAAVIFTEKMDDSVWGVKALQNLMGAAPLVVIPYLENNMDRIHGEQRLKFVAIVFCLILILLLIYTHYFYQRVDSILLEIVEGFGF